MGRADPWAGSSAAALTAGPCSQCFDADNFTATSDKLDAIYTRVNLEEGEKGRRHATAIFDFKICSL